MEWLEELDTDTLLQTIEQQLQQELPSFSVRNLFYQLINGGDLPAFSELLQEMLQTLLADTAGHFHLLGQLILLAIVFALLRQLEGSFGRGNIQNLSGIMVQAAAVLLILESGQQVLEYASAAVYRMTSCMMALLPVQMLLMTLLGNIRTAGLLQPSLLFMVQAAAVFFRTVLLPLVTMEFLLKLINSFSDTYRMTGLAAFLRKVILTSISFFIMLFLAVLSLQGIGGKVMDHLALRTARYIAGSAVPVVGGMLSGLMDTFLSGGLAIKNAVGVVGLLAILLLTVLPAVKILVLYFLYSFAAALLQPLGDTRMISLMEQAAGSFMLAFAVVVLTGILFFFMILIVLAAGGAAL